MSLAIYLATLSRDVGIGDSAELSLQAFKLGVTHPPGYPVHTVLGKVCGLLIADPALATNVLSALCMSIAVGLLGAIALRLARHSYAAVAGALIFAFVPTVWTAAVTTEVYGVNICIVAGALLLTLRWRDRPTHLSLCGIAVLLGVSLGSGLANVLLIPGFAILIREGARRKARELLLAGSLFAVTACAVMSWSWMRCEANPPLGSAYLPNTLAGFIAYVSGAQYTTLSIQPLDFYASRLVEHTTYWGASLMWLGVILGFIGFVWHWRRQRVICVSLLVMFAANLGYFTFYPWIDYSEMVVPAYFVFAIWMACGIRAVEAERTSRTARMVSVIISVTVVVGVLTSGVRTYRERGGDKPVTQFVRATFELVPPDAVLIAHWYDFTPLVFFQETQGMRPDLTIVECCYGIRHYQWGKVRDWREFARKSAAARPIVIDEIGAQTFDMNMVTAIGPGWYRGRDWYRVDPAGLHAR
ncbi:MAG: DUF2723 domain-containing protein [Phycisphaerales bacterium]|nr:MAG: DUF2723 domain-containing protein [Phycisphaerales bacterium]